MLMMQKNGKQAVRDSKGGAQGDRPQGSFCGHIEVYEMFGRVFQSGGECDIIKQFVGNKLMSVPVKPAEQFLYQVHPSHKSDTAIRLTRRPIPPNPSSRPPQENPYVYKPKSYSKKRTCPDTPSPAHTPPHPNKKFRTNLPLPSITTSLNSLDTRLIAKRIQQQQTAFFTWPSGELKMMQPEGGLRLPLPIELPSKARRNPQLSNKIEIVSTDNSKLMVSIHQGLLRANTNHSKQEQSLQGIANPFNARLKTYFSNTIPFVKEYKSGYAPIELQNRSKKEDEGDGGYEDGKQGRGKAHFIKKKQSTLSLPRTCGVSYIKPSQSVQGPPYEPLPPLIFQCSTSCNYSPQLRQQYHPKISQLINLSLSRWLPAILTTEEHMRDLLLGKPRGRVIWVNGLLNLWPLFNEGVFLLVLMQEECPVTEEAVWRQFTTCHFKLGILAKRSTSGKKLFLKSIQMDEDKEDKEETLSLNALRTDSLPPIDSQQGEKVEEVVEEKKMEESPPQERKQCRDVCEEFMRELKNSRTVITMSLKFEMYIHESQWKGLDSTNKNLLNAIIHSYEEHLQKKSIEVIRDRLQLASPAHRQELLQKAVSNIRMGASINHLSSATSLESKTNIPFSLKVLECLIGGLQTRGEVQTGVTMPSSEVIRDKQGKENVSLWQKSLKMPIYYISTRDSFAFDLVERITLLQRNTHTYKKIQYFFQADNVPDNFAEYRKLFPDLRVGITSYHDFFTEEELKYFEGKTLETERAAFKNKFLQMTVQPTIVGNRIKRTKFFFGYRYMWTRCQLAEPTSYVGAGVRRDVTPAPAWLRDVQAPLEEHGIVEPGFLNSTAINVYHDGTEGLAQHFDDAVRFKQPIYTLRLVSDGRLSFGSQFYGFCNGAFIIPLPRGCICRMEESSYAANGVKHCVRPCDMSGKSAAIILRQMHHQVVSEAARYDQLIDFPAWLSTLSEHPAAITFAEQKRRQAEQILAQEEGRKEKVKQIQMPPIEQ